MPLAHTTQAMPLGGLDLSIIGIYFVVVLFIGFWMARKTESGEDLFLAGRSLGWAPIGFSLFASNISSTTLIGLAGAAYASGISVANYEWMATVVLVFFVIYFVPFYIRSRISTMPEFLERRFDRRSRFYFSGLNIFTSVVIDTAGSLYAGAIVLQLFFPELSITTTCAVLAVVAGLYTAAGGLAAVVYTDVIQAVVLMVGATVLTFIVFGEVGYSWDQVRAVTPAGMLSLIRPMSDKQLPWLGTLVGVPILGFYFWCTNQFIVQRVLGAKDVDNARWGSLLGGLLKLPVLFIMVLPGTMARAVLPNLENGDLVFPTMVTTLLPTGMIGLVMAGLIAAIMSSIDSTLNSASTLVTLDFVKARYPNLSPKATAKVGRWVIGIFMIFAALWAPQIAKFPGLFHYLQQALAFIVPPVVAIFILGVFWRRGSPSAALITLIGGHLISAVAFVVQKVIKLEGVVDLHFTILAGLLTFVSMGIFVAASLVTPPPSESQVAELTLSGLRGGQWPAPAKPAFKDHRVQSVVLLALTAALVVAYW
ncbi:MAG: sodium:solute symporter [Deltaproteobacteria bacterium]|nr:sodium:solute symporter [Deltaproteobacteria bacterium]